MPDGDAVAALLRSGSSEAHLLHSHPGPFPRATQSMAEANHFAGVAEAELFLDMGAVGFDGFHAEVELGGNFLACQILRPRSSEHLEFAVGETSPLGEPLPPISTDWMAWKIRRSLSRGLT